MIVVAAAAGAFYWQGEREKTRERLERERVASEQAEIARVKEAEERRERERVRLVEEIRAQKDAEEAQRQQAIAIRQSETRDKQFVTDDRYVTQTAFKSYQVQLDQHLRENDTRRQRYENASSVDRARQEAERQKRDPQH